MGQGDRKHGKTAALVGGGALLVWLLMRGTGWGVGGQLGATTAGPKRRIRIRVSGAGVSVDGAPVTVDEAVAIARKASGAEVFSTGAARQGTVDDLIAGLHAAGVDVWRVGGSHA